MVKLLRYFLSVLLVSMIGMSYSAVFTVNSSADTDNGLGDNSPSGSNTLRKAIRLVNEAGYGPHTINFNLSSPYTISITSDLPSIINQVIIDGTSQSGYLGTPLVVIRGGSFSNRVIELQSSGSVVKGIRITETAYLYLDRNEGIAIKVSSASSCQILNNIVTRVRYGIYINNSDGTVIKGNRMGTTIQDSVGYGNFIHIRISNSDNTVIGSGTSGEGNLLTSTYHWYAFGKAIQIESGSDYTVIKGNNIGSNGSDSLSRGTAAHGIFVQNGNTGTVIGGSAAGEGNLISGHAGYGIFLKGASNVTIKGNKIGTNAAGTSRIQNYDGIVADGASNIVIGGSGTGEGNLISGNQKKGIWIRNACNTVTIKGNKIGTDINGTARLYNKDGIAFIDSIQSPDDVSQSYAYTENSSNVVIGGSLTGEGNIISGNSSNGIWMYKELNAPKVIGNIIGLNAAGNAILYNKYGIFMDNCKGKIQIGGSSLAEGNIISGSLANGVHLFYTDSVTVSGNYIGTDKSGENAKGNQGYGIQLYNGHANTIGGSSIYSGNVISGNGGYGISFYSGSNNNTVSNNKIGTDALGNKALGNTLDGINFSAGSGTNTLSYNLISGNQNGIYSTDGSSNLKIIGNKIGTNLNANAAIPNQNGIYLTNGSSYAQIGGSGTNEGNTISGNIHVGIVMESNNDCKIYSNRIGVKSDGNLLGNGDEGLRITSSNNNTVGGVGTKANIIAGNGTDGIYVHNATPDEIRKNSIYANGDLAIDLENGNINKPSPAITGASYVKSTSTLTLIGTSEAGDSIEVFTSEISGKNAYVYMGEGKADGSGNWSITLNGYSGNVNYFVATATSELSNPARTSELSSVYAFQACQGFTSVIHSVTKTDADCYDKYSTGKGWYNTGTVSISASGGTGTLKYSLNGAQFQTGASFDSLKIGNYTVWVQDDNGCQATSPFTILYKGPVISDVCADRSNCSPSGSTRVKFTITRQSPSGSCAYSFKVKRKSDGAIVLSSTGSFNAEHTDNISSALAGNYTLLLLPLGCNSCDTLAKDFIILPPPAFSVTASNFNNPKAISVFYTCGLTDGLKMLFKVSGNNNSSCHADGITYTDSIYKYDVATKNYIFDNKIYSGSNDTISFQLPQGKYKFTSTVSPYGCKAIDFYFEIQPTTLDINVSKHDPLCNGSTGYANAVILSGQDPLKYSWFHSGNTADTLSKFYQVTNLAEGNYSLYVNDGRGCLRTKDFAIIDPPVFPTPTISTSPCSAIASVDDNGRGPFTFHWIFMDVKNVSVPDTAHFRLYPDSAIRFVTVRDTFEKEVFVETVNFASSGKYTSNPKTADTAFIFETGKYKVRVVDVYGCEKWSAIDSIPPANFTRNYALYFKWKSTPVSVPEEPEPPTVTITGLPPGGGDIGTAIESQSQDCVNKKVATVKDQYLSFCNSPDSTSDYLTVSYNLHYMHTTLYYYDRAGNLTKTVSPEGVNRLTTKPTTRNDSTNYTLATTYDYNTLKQLVKQNTPDGGATNFIYDNKGQLRFSQNARQLGDTSFSYTKYDYLGRITEVGESKVTSSFASLDNNIYLLSDTITGASYPYTNNKEQTWTFYSNEAPWASYMGVKGQRFLQNRVSYTATHNKNGDSSYTYFSYDPHGNVEWMEQDVPGFSAAWTGYEYDLISNKVLKVKYNEYLNDRMFHRYSYDEDNRITSVETSRDGYLWDKDAVYNYYAHGPLRRTELGQDRLQGTDYTYTIQGWLKGINSPNLKKSEDPGEDGKTPTQGGEFAPDQFGMMLGYFEGDFKRTGSALNAVSSNPYYLTNYGKNLYNGNISTWTSRIAAAKVYYGDSLSGFAYSYDRLNRLKTAQYHNFTSSFNSTNSYKEQFSYDANGNILNLTRRATNDMDQLAYSYYDNTNKLKRVTDAISASAYNMDIDNQSGNNYVYDAIGNLIKDSSECINVKWNVYGKVSEVVPIYKAGRHHTGLRFEYDASGNRIIKEVNDSAYATGGVAQRLPQFIRTTYYVRDASGNVMSIYERIINPYSGDSLFTATYTQKEVPIYGSDRLGSWNADSIVASTIFHKRDMDRVSIVREDHLLRKTEQDSSLASFHLKQNIKVSGKNTFIQGAFAHVKSNDVSLLKTTGFASDTAFIGCIGNNVTMAYDSLGKVKFYSITAEKYFGSKDVLLLYDRDGNLMPGSEGISSDSRTKAVSFAVPNSPSKYYLLTRSLSGKLQYAVIDMNAAGNGSITGGLKGAVVRTDSITVPSGTLSFGRNMTVAEDKVNDKVYVLATAWKQDTTYIEKITFENEVDNKASYKVTHEASLAGKDSLGQGELEISPNGKQLAIYNHQKRSGWFAHRKGEIAVFNLDYDFSIYKDKVTGESTIATAPAQKVTLPYVTLLKSSVSFSKDSKELVYSQNCLTNMSSALNNNKAVWKYDLFKHQTVLADTGKAGDLIRTKDYLTLSAGVNKKYASKFAFDPQGNITKTSYLVNGDTLYTARYPQENHRIYDASENLEMLLARNVGSKLFEVKDHLGNVRVVLSDAKNTLVNGSGQIVGLATDVRDYNNFYAFGMQMPGKSMVSGNGYPIGFNGKRFDTEWNKGGAMYDYGFRIYDPRIARFLSVDPLADSYPWYTPYQFAGNTPIQAIDLDGAEEFHYTRTQDKDGNIVLTLTHVNDLVDVEWSFWNGDTPGVWYEQKINQRQVHIVHQSDEIFYDGCDCWKQYDESVEYDSYDAASKSSDADFRLTGQDNFWLLAEYAAISKKEKQGFGSGRNAVHSKNFVKPKPDYSTIKDSKSVGPGKNFTPAQKRKILEVNKAANGGVIKSDKSGTVADQPAQSKSGVPANMNQAEVDHIIPKSNGGTNSSSNAQVLTKKENIKKSNKTGQ